MFTPLRIYYRKIKTFFVGRYNGAGLSLLVSVSLDFRILQKGKIPLLLERLGELCSPILYSLAPTMNRLWIYLLRRNMIASSDTFH